MKQFEVNGVRYIGVEVPEGSFMFSADKGDLHYYFEDRDYTFNHNEALPAGNYEIVGLVSSLKDNNYENVSKLYPYTTYTHRARLCIELIRDYNLTDSTLILKIKENE